jgi:LPXTG-motif cell wall-anchored protein
MNTKVPSDSPPRTTLRSVRSRVTGAVLLIMGAVLTVSVAVAPDQSPVIASPVQLQSTPTWSNTAVSALALGEAHTCAVRNGVLYCWGSGLNYRLGNNSTNDQLKPIKVLSTADFTNNGTVSAVAPGHQHTCAIEDGVAHCWGTEFSGALGLGSTIIQQTPAKVTSTNEFANNGGVTALAVGAQHTCAIENGVVFCWGSGTDGRLGNASTSSQNIPVRVHSTGGFTNNGTVSALSVGDTHACAIEGGAVYCWGRGTEGQLGNGANTEQPTPIKVSAAGGLTNNGNVTSVATGFRHTCAVDSGEVFCWGLNWHPTNPGALSDSLRSGGQLGDGTNVAKNQPVKVLSTNGMANNGTVSAVAAGYAHTCATEGGVLYCWGSRSNNQLGDGNFVDNRRLSPVLVAGNSVFTNAGVTSVSVGFSSIHSCAVRNGVAYCWGMGSNGRLGHGTGDGRQTPEKVFSPVIPVPSAPSITGVTSGFGQLSVSFTAPSSDGGNAISNYEYSTDDGTTWAPRSPASASSPLVIGGLTNETTYTIKLRAVNDGGPGASSSGSVGTPSALWSNTAASTVAGGGTHSCAVSSGTLYCWGANGSGELGIGTNTNATIAQRVTPANGFLNTGNVSVVKLGGNHSCAIESGVLYCWGFNDFGQVGDGTTTAQNTPVKVTPGNGFANSGTVSAVALGAQHTCAIEGGVVFCWGANGVGQLGDDSSTPNATAPVKVTPSNGFTNNGTVSALGTGNQHSCVIEGGVVFCWGANASGQVGDGSTASATESVKVTPGNGFTNNGTVSAIALGGAHTCTIEGSAPNAVAYCWGSNTQGQLGDGTQINATSPVKVTPGGGFNNNGTVSLFATGGEHTCVLAAGVAYCWGATLGVSPAQAQTAPVKVPDGGGFTNTGLLTLTSGGGSASDGTSCVIKNGAVLCWGANDAGQLGNGNTVAQTGPTPMQAGSVSTVPSAPTITGITAGSGQLSVAFTAPSSDGGSPVTNYRYSVDGGTNWVTRSPASTTSPWVITGLTNGTSYTVVLSAINGVGASVASGNSTATPTAGGSAGTTPPPPPTPATTPATTPTTVAPSASVPAGPAVLTPPTPGAEPTLITADDATSVQQEPGSADVVIDGQPTDVQVMNLDIPSARVDPQDRTPAQVAAVQQAGAALVNDFNSLTPPGAAPLVTITNTATGAVANGVLVDPRNGTTPVPVPVEDLVLVSASQTKVLLAAATADAVPEKVTRGVVTVRPSGVVAALAQGFDPSTPGEVIVFSTPTLLGTFTTDVNGTFTGQMTLPPDIQPGEHTLVLTTGSVTTSLGLLIDADGNAVIVDPTDPTVPTDPTPPAPTPGVLPATGNDAGLMIWGLGLMAAGVLMLISRRRRIA